MLFAETFGHDLLAAHLRRMSRQDRLPHAQIFLGPEGCGALGLALALAQYVQCVAPSEEDACGQCDSCLKMNKHIHPDVHFSFPVVGGKTNTSQYFLEEWRSQLAITPYFSINEWLQFIQAGNKQGNISRDECVQIVKKLSLKTFEGSHKILIMWRPEFLGKEGNRLLKMIEEPPANTLFFLVAERPELILNTILSRCQIVKIPALSDEAIRQQLEKIQPELPAADRLRLAAMANGNFAEAQRLLANNQNREATLFLEWMRLCYKINSTKWVRWIDQFAELGRENQKQFFHYAHHFLREMWVLKSGSDQPIRLGEKEAQTARKMQQLIPMTTFPQISALFSDSVRDIERNANPKILMMHASWRMHHFLHSDSKVTS